jgi:hypothetical protein
MKTFLIVAGVFVVLALVGIMIGRGVSSVANMDPKSRKALATLTQAAEQAAVDNAAKNVEFYKIEYGHYPRTLDALTRNQPFLYFKNIQYQRIGEKYALYSVGPDGIAHTADDIYPSNFPDTSNFGWIKDPNR